MVAITLDEKKLISEKFPNVYIVRTMKRASKRHKYYMVENRAAMKYLHSLRNDKVVSSNANKGA